MEARAEVNKMTDYPVFKAGNREYEVDKFLTEKEAQDNIFINGNELYARAAEQDTFLGKDDIQYILDNRKDTEQFMKNNNGLTFLIIDWKNTDGRIRSFRWSNTILLQEKRLLSHPSFGGQDRFLRRIF